MANRFLQKLRFEHSSWIMVATLCTVAFTLLFLFDLGADFLTLRHYIIYFLFTLIPIGIFCLWKPSKFKSSLVTIYFAAIVILYPCMWSSRKSFLMDLDKIEIGMTQLEVQRIMGKYIVGTGWPAFGLKPGKDGGGLTEVGSGQTFETTASATGELELKDSITYRHSNEGKYDSDWGVVKFENNRVVSVEFLPD